MAKKQHKTQASEFCIEFGKHIRELRKGKNLSIEEIAFKADLDAQNLRKYELGKQEMKIGMLKRIADAFDITPSELIDF
jgi:transcriptional regulator with XRE-family HTH domain